MTMEQNPVNPKLNELTIEDKRQRLDRFTAGIDNNDREMTDYWRNAAPEIHASAMAQLSDYASRLSQETGLGKDPNEMFPGFPKRAGVGQS